MPLLTAEKRFVRERRWIVTGFGLIGIGLSLAIVLPTAFMSEAGRNEGVPLFNAVVDYGMGSGILLVLAGLGLAAVGCLRIMTTREPGRRPRFFWKDDPSHSRSKLDGKGDGD